MDFADTPEQAAFRAEVRGWLAANLPEAIRVDDAADQRIAPDREILKQRIAWQKTMHAAGWVGLSWPREYGGRGASFIQQVIFDEEYTRARAPVLPAQSGLSLLGPTLIHWGNEAQKQRYLPPILRADELWCQGYSEPGAGADLAGLRTRAVDQGDHFLVNGQKVWTSGAHFADWCFLLVRTNPDAPKHQGISYLLVDMKTPGITVRPLVLLNGHRHFNEVFFEDVKVPKENLVGPLNQGWKVAITTLMFERSGAGGRDHAQQIARLVELAKQLPTRQEPAWNDTHVRQQLAQLAIEAKALEVTRLRGLTRRLRGEPPGPEGSILKLFGSELAVRISDFASALLGLYATIDEPTEAVADAPRWYQRVLGARQYTIAGGTSEIQRNIIGERVLGLPKG
ncbi:MAG TPA: acyl-CoA dehydrogenase [Candidatus Sulfotelmatobacter sp.]|nr:acyl-CoA dehydrogenase [Candidatus Sulfotelmatobacter sp.]